ncbi:MAG: signal peptide peptidase SppA [Gammaproteobacteria bacterium]|nr:signal peptide peptidase SppA [Gammaproteobacteria bacterium]NNC97396.1 signal peptide peptidase SppA [Gammaproteobacteria bacterium]NNM14453.1 signal peptide peptidase SppA [Gammaproteobacteria bacterium]
MSAAQTKERGIIGKVFHWIWRPFDIVRRVLHLLLLLMIFAFIFAGMSGSTPKPISEPAALVLSLQGSLVEELSGDPIELAIADAQGQPVLETTVKELVDTIRAASKDDKIPLIVLDLDRFTGGGLSKMQVVAEEIKAFKASGKPVYVYANFMSQNQYFFAALADEIHLHPQGAVLIEGYGRYRMFYKEAIDKLLIDWNVFKVGEYKSYVEPYIRNNMSEEDKASSMVWMGAMWDSFSKDVETERELQAGAITAYSNNLDSIMQQNGGSFSQAAMDNKLVDKLSQRTEFRKMLIDKVGKHKKESTFKQVSTKRYTANLKLKKVKKPKKADKIAVVVAAGTILDGSQPSGSIGGDSTSKLIRKATDDKTVKALVLKVDSGGGSAFASDVILNAIQEFKDSGRPVITSMSSVAASGGYMISLAANEIWATPSTITGSIGIFGMIPTFERSLDKLGLHVDGIGTTELSGALQLGRGMDENVARIIQANIEHGYDDFISKVADARGMDKAAVDKIARGRVWFAQDALENGLVDKLGSFEDAVAAAAELADLEDYQIKYIKKELSFSEQLAINFFAKASGASKYVESAPEWQKGTVGAILKGLNQQLERLVQYNDPLGVYADCLCAQDL